MSKAVRDVKSFVQLPRRALPAVVSVALAGILIAALPAATPEAPVEVEELELEEITVVSTVPRPIEDYVEFPRYDSVTISPSAKYIVTGWTEDNYQRQLSFIDFPSMKPHNKKLLQQFLGVADVRWVNEEQVLVQPDWPRHGFIRRRSSLRSIMITDIEGRGMRELNPTAANYLEPLDLIIRDEAVDSGPRQLNTGRTDHPDNGKKPDREALGPVRAVEARTGVPDQIMLQTTRTDRDGNTDGYGVFLMNARDGKQTRVATLPLANGEVLTGPEHQVALVHGVNARNERVVYYLPPEARAQGKDWQQKVKSPSGERSLQPVAWTGKGEEYYALEGRNLPTRAVVVWNASDNTQKLLYRNPDVDMENASIDPAGIPWMYSGMGHYPFYWYPDPEHPLAKLHTMLAKQLANESIDITSASDDMAYAVARVNSGKRPPMFMVLDVKNMKSLNGMQTYPLLRGTRIAPVEPIEFRARDGLLIRGYLTTPVDERGRPRKNLPLVVTAHDSAAGQLLVPLINGPLAQPADYRYEYERQLLASRGYAVLQINHRGTSGRGRAFERLGDGQWGRAVQDDYIEGIRWALQDGVAGKGRVCMYGTGYGAFSAMITAARAPDLIQCVVAVGGVYDLPMQFDNDPKKVPLHLQQALGTDMAELKARSPVSNAATIKGKVLLMHQQGDMVSSEEQSNAMRRALKTAGNAPTWETIAQNYSSYFTPQSRADVYTKIMSFMNKNIGKEK